MILKATDAFYICYFPDEQTSEKKCRLQSKHKVQLFYRLENFDHVCKGKISKLMQF